MCTTEELFQSDLLTSIIFVKNFTNQSNKYYYEKHRSVNLIGKVGKDMDVSLQQS